MRNINLDLVDLRALLAVADQSNFRAAAQALHLSQPALSRRIGRLEAALGVRLFERTTRQVSLTPVGRDFSARARYLVREMDASFLEIRDIAAARGGEVSVACVPTAANFFLPGVLREYSTRYPKVRVRVLDGGANEVLSLVLRGDADFGLNIAGLVDRDIEFQEIYSEPFVLACRRDHALAGRRRLSWAELARHDTIALDKSSGNRRLIDTALARAGVQAQPRYEVRHLSTLLGLVEAGLGIAAVPRLAVPDAGHPTLVHVALGEPAVTRSLGLITRRGRPLTAAAEPLHALVRKAARKMAR